MPRADCLERLVPPPGTAVPWKAKKEAPFWVWTQGADGFCLPRNGQIASGVLPAQTFPDIFLSSFRRHGGRNRDMSKFA